MNGEELDKLLKRAIGPKYVGIFAADEIQSILDRGGGDSSFCFIANTDYSHEPGEHWVAFYVVSPILEFFDSYGQHPHVYFPHLQFVSSSSHLPYTLHFNNQKLQKFNSSVCAHYCLYYVYLRVVMHKSMNSIINSLSQYRTPHPDQSVKSFFIRVLQNFK